uniref:Tetratricopeptide repeat protein 21A/21B N-terminal ARM repeat domain-containing protein n=1 Tax=Hucho hucho TaxID=62062 RepID=A0A4W5KD36_9TELE
TIRRCKVCYCLLSADHEAVSALETHVRNIRKTAEEKPLFYGALFLWLVGRVDKAKDYIDKILKISKSSKEGSILKGWVDMNSEDEFQRNNAICYLDGGGQLSRDVFGLMGKVPQCTAAALPFGSLILNY